MKTLSEKPDDAYQATKKYFEIDILKKCGKSNSCYAKELGIGKDGGSSGLAAWAKSFETWGADEKLSLLEGHIERAMLEIGKQGSKAQSLTETLLDNAKSDNRIIRQSILLALPKIAKIPCNTCEEKLQKAIRAGEGKTTLGNLNLETTILKYYFSWAGGKTPSKPKLEADDIPAPSGP